MGSTNDSLIAKRLGKVVDLLFDGNQSDMSRAMGMSPQGMNPYFNGDRKPGFKIIKRLVELGINATWVVSGVPPIMISDINDAGVVKIDFEPESDSVINEPKGGHYSIKEKSKTNAPGNQSDFFAHIDNADLTSTEESLLAEVKQFSDSLKNLNVPLQVKRLLLELMIEHIGQEIERLQKKGSK